MHSIILLCTLSTSNYLLSVLVPSLPPFKGQNRSSTALSASFLIRSTIPYACQRLYADGLNTKKTYSRHNGLTIVSFYITEGHFDPLMFVDNDLGIIDILNLFQWH